MICFLKRNITIIWIRECFEIQSMFNVEIIALQRLFFILMILPTTREVKRSFRGHQTVTTLRFGLSSDNFSHCSVFVINRDRVGVGEKWNGNTQHISDQNVHTSSTDRLQLINTSTHQHINTSTHQHINTSEDRHTNTVINTSTHRQINRQHINTSTHQHNVINTPTQSSAQWHQRNNTSTHQHNVINSSACQHSHQHINTNINTSTHPINISTLLLIRLVENR
jgi:hypothetical protein